MSVTSDPKEERAYARAFVALVEHVGPCGDCAELVRAAACTGCGKVGRIESFSGGSGMQEQRLCAACTDGHLERVMRVRCNGKITSRSATGYELVGYCFLSAGHDGPCDEKEPVKSSLAPAPLVLDLSDPNTPLCSRGMVLRGQAVVAREATPAERLIAFYGLESPDVLPADAHDAARGATWLRGDPGEARVIMTQLVDRAGPLEDRETSTAALREGFLKGFRQRFPSRGSVPSEAQKAKRSEAADRLCMLIVDRYEKRHGAPPSVAVIEAFRKTHDVWVMSDGAGDLERMADDAEKFRATHARRWSLKALLKPKDPLDELKKIARWIAESLIEGETALG